MAGPARWKATLRLVAILVALLVGLAALSFLHPQVRYVATAAGFQLEVLWGRVPVEDAIAAGHFTDEQIVRLRQVPGIKAHALQMGLADTGHYSTINPTWTRTVWNISACEELAFTPRTWWFPIVGRVPYLGFFDEAVAREAAAALADEGLDVHVRTAGAWSTLGWFEDPLLPDMATWPEARLADTLHHELTHATVWIPGSVAFNESLASFVGERGGMAYMVETYGEDSAEVREHRAYLADRDAFMAMMTEVYGELDAIYTDDALDKATRRKRKAEILGGLPDRARRTGFSDPERWATWLEQEPWNNAQLVQFRVYNRSPSWFAALLEEEDGDWRRFLTRVERIGRGSSDPYRGLAEEVGVDPDTIDGPVR